MFNRFSFCVVAFFTLILLSIPVYAVPDGLVHHWNFDEGPDWHEDAFATVCNVTIAYDSVGAADAFLQNMDPSSWVSGNQFTALQFDGQNAHLLTQIDLSAVLGNTSTLAYWVQTTAVSSPGVTGSDQIQWGGIDDSGNVTLSVDSVTAVTSTLAINDGTWHHITITRDAATGEVQIFIDGELSASSIGPSGVISIPFSSIAMVEGISPASGYFTGRLDQIHVFDKVIDSATITEIIDNHAPKTWEKTTAGTNGAPFSTASVFFNSYDVEQDMLSVVSFGQAENGLVENNGDGTFTYTPDPGFVGYDSFVVVIEDGKGGFRRSAVTVSVAPDSGLEGDKRTTVFSDYQAIQAGGANISLSGMRVPRAIDWDSNGLNDMLVGHSGAVWRYMNTGTVTSPVFATGVRVQANGSNISLSGTILIALADMTGDGVDDLVAVSSDRRVRVYRNTSAPGLVPVYAASYYVKKPNNTDFVLPDQRFDIGDWDGDGLNDVIMGNRSGEMRAYRNVGTAATAKFDTSVYEVLVSGSYNLYPRLFDISRNGVPDFIHGINWGSISYWFDPLLNGGLVSGGTLVITDSSGATVDVRAGTDGAMVDFADFNGDGIYDLITGGYAGSNIFIAYGQAKTVADIIAENEAIYDANLSNLGPALEANDQELLDVINSNSRAIISHMQAGTLPEREQMFALMAAHVGRYSFLQLDHKLDTTLYHHLPSIAGQNLITMHQMLQDTPTHRANVADAVGLEGSRRQLYLETFLHIGENHAASVGQMESVIEYITSIPREIFPDSMITMNHYYGDGRGGTVNSFRGAKNIFSSQTGNDSGDGFANDHDPVIESIFGSGAYLGDYFTLVMGHEVTHSLDGYVRRCANDDLERRWNQSVVYAAGPDVMRGADGWVDWNATKAKFQAEGYWDGVSATWDASWEAYWASGPGNAFRKLSFMRGNINIDWFLGTKQESLATQANQNLSHSEGRLVAAIDRYRRGIEDGNAPMKANINECVTFIDFVSAGLNEVVMFDTRGVQTPYPRVDYTITYAKLVRDDRGYITKISIEDRIYDFVVDSDGIVVDVSTNIMTVADDSTVAFHRQYNVINVLGNDNKLEGGKPVIAGFTQPMHGIVSDKGDGTLRYVVTDDAYLGTDSFTYTGANGNGQGETVATVAIKVVGRSGILKETYTGIGGDAVSYLTSSSKYPSSPDTIDVVTSFQTPQNTGTSYGTRMSGWLKPAVTGMYTFWIASDDSSELWLSVSSIKAKASMICSVVTWTSYKQWNNQPSQQSVARNLIGGQSYYIEALHKEGGGSDHLAVAWSGPGISQQIIDGAYMSAIYPDPPELVEGPIVLAAAYEGREYSGTVSGSIVDGSAGIEFSVVGDSYWLSMASDGSVSGLPADDDAGLNMFTLRALNTGGAFSDNNLEIDVYDTSTGELGVSDFANISSYWLETGCVDFPECGGNDLTGDGNVDLDDLVVFFEYWLN